MKGNVLTITVCAFGSAKTPKMRTNVANFVIVTRLLVSIGALVTTNALGDARVVSTNALPTVTTNLIMNTPVHVVRHVSKKVTGMSAFVWVVPPQKTNVTRRETLCHSNV